MENENTRLGRIYLQLKEKPNTKYLSGELDGNKYVVYTTKDKDKFILDIYQLANKRKAEHYHALEGGFF